MLNHMYVLTHSLTGLGLKVMVDNMTVFLAYTVKTSDVKERRSYEIRSLYRFENRMIR